MGKTINQLIQDEMNAGRAYEDAATAADFYHSKMEDHNPTTNEYLRLSKLHNKAIDRKIRAENLMIDARKAINKAREFHSL